jgi:hypothetical protein
MNGQERVEALLKLLAVQNQNLMVMLGSLHIWHAPEGTPKEAMDQMGAQVGTMIKQSKEILVAAMGIVAEGARQEREAAHREMSEAEKLLEEAMRKEMDRKPIGFK